MVKWIMLNNTLDKYRYIQYSSEVLSLNCTRKARLKKNTHTRAAFKNTLKIHGQKKLISMYNAVFFFYPLFDFEWCIRFITKEGFRCWWHYLVSSRSVWGQFIYEMALDIGKKKEKVSDLQGTSSESKQDQERLSSIKSLS